MTTAAAANKADELILEFCNRDAEIVADCEERKRWVCCVNGRRPSRAGDRIVKDIVRICAFFLKWLLILAWELGADAYVTGCVLKKKE